MLRSSLTFYSFKDFKYDFTAGIVVFLVAIPLCLGIALASGAPLFSGLLAGIIGGIVVGLISESAVSVSGPAAGMVAVVLAAISELGNFNTFLLALLFAGILQVIIGSLRAGFIADYFPSNVIQGLLCAIGILIIIKQLPFAFTHTSHNDALMDLIKENANTLDIYSIKNLIHPINVGAVIITLISFATLIFFEKTKNSRLKLIPGPVVVVILGAVINEIYSMVLPIFSQYNNELVNIPIHENLQSFIDQFQSPTWASWSNPKVYLYAFILAAVASLEALLNLEAIEKLDVQKRYCSRNRELIAQGLGNMLAGLIGGIPITSVVIRGSVNIQAGARTKLSTIIHGLSILFVVLLLPTWINLIPLASLASILIFVGYKLTKPYIYSDMYAQGLSRFLPFLVTVIAILATNLLTGILIGLFTSFFFILKNNSEIQLDIINEKHPLGTVKRIILPQHMSFLRKASLVNELDNISENSNLIIDARYTKYMDQDILEILNTFRLSQAPDKNIALNILGFKEHYEIHNHINFLDVTTYDTQANLMPHQVLDVLKEGNKRFINDTPIHRNLPEEIKATSHTQYPIAIVLGCIDSRVPIETIFDMGVGDVFVARIAGNVINDDIIGSMEFACDKAGAKLIVILGHTFCGAIKAACSDTNQGSGYLPKLLDKITPSVLAEQQAQDGKSIDDNTFLTNVTKLNVENTLQTILNKSDALRKLIDEKNLGLIGAIYDVSSGVVTFNSEKIFH